ncbi:MAG: HdeD family acid-resistance protein [Chthoniobacterales bacterium]|nr:HdeD family acid-resistance protein [Chthoniobacterales bacterium]
MVPRKNRFHRAGFAATFSLAMTSNTTRNSPAWTMFQGILLIVLGALAIIFPLVASIAVEQLFAALLLIAGGYALAAALGRKESGFAHRMVSALWAVLTLATGLLLLFKIGAGVLTLTILLASYFAAQGIVTIISAFRFSGTGTMWMMLLSGVVSLVLSWMIFSGFPGSAVWLLGLLFGINLMFTGAFFISMSSALKAQEA